jgi:hypothetical protein
MNSLERELGIEQIDRMLPFLRYDHYGMHFWGLPKAFDFDNAVEIGYHMGKRYCYVVRNYPKFKVHLSEVLLAINLQHDKNRGYFIGFTYAIDNLIREGATG